MSPEVSTLLFPSVQELAPWVEDLPDDDPEVEAAMVAARADGYDAGFAEGRADGEQEGFRAGFEAGRAAAVRSLEQAAAALHAAAHDLAARDAVALGTVSTELAEVAVAVVEGILGREVAALDDPGRAALERALAMAPDRGPILARLHPEDHAAVAAIATELAPGRDIEVIGDPTVEPGGAVVEVGACRVDAQLSAALDRVREVLAP